MSEEIFKYKYDDLFNPLLSALHHLGGSGSISEIEYETSNVLNLSEEELSDIHRGNSTKFSYRLAWARNYLKRFELLENSTRGVWALTEKGQTTTIVDKEEVKQFVKQAYIKSSKENKKKKVEEIPESEISDLNDISWREELLEILKKIPPENFERLCQRLLRELGFVNVEVTQRSNDGGIDGKGVIRLGGVMSFHVVFQAKRYRGQVGTGVIRDFRGAMIGRADKGLILTTGSFTREAKKEAQRAGAPPIDLVDGNDFTEKLKELKLGIEIELVEQITIKKSWFQNF